MKSIVTSSIVLSSALLVVWLFPRFWYSRTDPRQGYFWLVEQNRLPGWQYQETPVSEAAEAVLAADKIVNGEFRGAGGTVVRVFSAKRYAERESEFDMFSHTPDRCWTSVGWKLEPTTLRIDQFALCSRDEDASFQPQRSSRAGQLDESGAVGFGVSSRPTSSNGRACARTCRIRSRVPRTVWRRRREQPFRLRREIRR